MGTRWRKWWPVVKTAIALAIMVFIGRQFWRDLQRPDLEIRSLDFGWLTLSGILYIAGLGLSALFWVRLLGMVGQHPRGFAAVRAYYVGHLGKYIPGKGWALLLRATLARSAGVRGSVAGLTTFYEVLATMAAGALLAAILFWFYGPIRADGLDWPALKRLLRGEDLETVVLDRQSLMLLALGLLAVVGFPLIPGIFNRLVRRMALPFQEKGAAPPPPLGWKALLEGLFLTAGGWVLLGASLWAVLQGVSRHPPSLAWDNLARLTAFLSLSYVVGFIVIPVPNGLGVREFFLMVCLSPDPSLPAAVKEEARTTAVVAVLLLRLVWTTAELIVAGLLYALGGSDRQAARRNEQHDFRGGSS